MAPGAAQHRRHNKAGQTQRWGVRTVSHCGRARFERKVEVPRQLSSRHGRPGFARRFSKKTGLRSRDRKALGPDHFHRATPFEGVPGVTRRAIGHRRTQALPLAPYPQSAIPTAACPVPVLPAPACPASPRCRASIPVRPCRGAAHPIGFGGSPLASARSVRVGTSASDRARTLARTGSGSVGHAVTTPAKSGAALAESAKRSAKR
jgi:hypothetical protein